MLTSCWSPQPQARLSWDGMQQGWAWDVKLETETKPRRDVFSSRDVKAGLNLVMIAVVKLFFRFISYYCQFYQRGCCVQAFHCYTALATLNDHERRVIWPSVSVCVISRKSVPLGAIASQWLKLDLHCLRQKYSRRNLPFSSAWLMRYSHRLLIKIAVLTMSMPDM